MACAICSSLTAPLCLEMTASARKPSQTAWQRLSRCQHLPPLAQSSALSCTAVWFSDTSLCRQCETRPSAVPTEGSVRSKAWRGAQWGSLVFSLRTLATMWRSEDKLPSCGSWGRWGPDVYHMGPQRSNSVSRFGSKHLLILGTILSALPAFFFLIQIMILL